LICHWGLRRSSKGGSVKIKEITIHNFRSLKHVTLALGDYSLLVGQNNTGKTSVLTAIRCFYEEGGAKFTPDLDFPKFSVDDNDSWVEVHFQTTDEEQVQLKKEYRSKDSLLRVRRYFKSDNKELLTANQSNIYAYEDGVLSSNLFYGAKNISQAKVGSAIYIPEVSKTDESLKLSGPSPLREMINFVMKRAVSKSTSFSDLQGAIGRFDEDFRKEASEDGFSVKSLIADINQNLTHWRIRLGVDINPLRPEDIVKSLLGHYIEDDNLDGKRVNISSYGQGLQRELIYTLIRLSTKFVSPRKEKKKDFDPDLTLILFEEPEAFLHPSQQDRLNAGLRSLAAETGQQALVTTHSPQFVSRQVEDFPSIIRLEKPTKVTSRFQLSKTDVENLFDENIGLYMRFSDLLKSADVEESI
jgi:predicted ATP-dependent endonuclease of OLD family